jgi:hypothetical protein
MKSKIYLLPVLFSLAVLYACEPIQDDSGNIAAKLEGQWKVEESGYKSTADFYYTTVEIHQSDSNKLLIYNFYDLGDNVSITVNVNGMSLEIPNQTTDDGSAISGSGTISSKFDKINWNYHVDIGDGSPQDLTAVYTKVY